MVILMVILYKYDCILTLSSSPFPSDKNFSLIFLILRASPTLIPQSIKIVGSTSWSTSGSISCKKESKYIRLISI